MDHALHHVLEPSQEYDLDLEVTQGTWPDGMAGHVFIIGPSQPNLADFVWSGFGIVTRVDLAPNAAGAAASGGQIRRHPGFGAVPQLARTLCRRRNSARCWRAPISR